MNPISFRYLIAAPAMVAGAAASQAAEVTVGARSEPAAMDPHFSYVATTQAATQHVFDTLIDRQPDLSPAPGLAVSWELVEPTVWQIKLREGVTFHDGSPFTAEDVVYSFERAANVPNSPAPWTAPTAPIKERRIVDDHTVEFVTGSPMPLFYLNFGELPIVSKAATEGKATEDFNAGPAAIGTGPYKMVEFTPGQSLTLEANADYWGGKPEFDNVTIKYIPNAAARVSALLSGDVDVIDAVPLDSIERLRGEDDVSLWSVSADRTMYIHMDSSRPTTPNITAKDGSEIPNPLLKPEVRRALAMALDRQAVVDRLLYGFGEVASQIPTPTMLGFNPDIPQTPYDSDGAKALLAEAGYPDGFKITIHSPNDRYVQDAQTAEAIAQMWSRIGLDVTVSAVPANVFFPAATNFDYSAFLIGFGSSTGTGIHSLQVVLMTRDKEKGWGSSNRGRYSNPEVDRLGVVAMETTDIDEHVDAVRKANAMAYDEVAIIPLHTLQNIWASRKGLKIEPRMDERTLAQGIETVE